MKIRLLLLAFCCSICMMAISQSMADGYQKIERLIPMRDGIKLFTAIYIPRDSLEKYPFLVMRTPYSCAPYGEDRYPDKLGPGPDFEKEKYIFVYQDVRGRYLSEGTFKEVTPFISSKKSAADVDESSDTYDTIEWLLKNIAGNNGNIGLYGISYPGFYATASLPDGHPAIKAVSPQAPVTDEFEGDDAYHRGAFFLMDNFSFLNYFDHPRSGPVKKSPPVSKDLHIKDAYSFYLNAGPLKNLDSLYFKGQSVIWNEYLRHSTKDAYWQARNIRTHLKNIKPAVLVVGGWFDAEDLFGALKTYEAIEQQNSVNTNRLIMGPWTHGAWSRSEWSKFGGYHFNENVNAWYQQTELAFFNYYLKQKGQFTLPEASIFVTGINKWESFNHWPPVAAKIQKWYLLPDKKLDTFSTAEKEISFQEYISDPAQPVPYTGQKSASRVNEYMVADQRFTASRSDVVSYTSSILTEDIRFCGPVTANLYVSTSGTDADFIVKIIDVLPDKEQTQQLVRAEVIRGKFRNSYEKPEPFVPGQPTPIKLVLNDIAHCFLKGHQLMVQIQSSWFPLVDRNPQQFLNIPEAGGKDFRKAVIRIYNDKKHSSNLVFSIY